jgi:hypothetical protein
MNFFEKWGRLKYIPDVADEPVEEKVLEPTPKAEKIGELGPCRICGENAWWLSVYGALRCGVCHPPVPGAVKKWIGDPECSARLKASGPAVVLSWEEARQRKAGGEHTP